MWKTVPGFEQYEASDCGLIRNSRTKRVLAASKNNRCVTLRRPQDTKTRSVGAWILETFRGPKPKAHFVACHGPAGCGDNSLNNLYWGSPTQNMRDKVRDGTRVSGEQHPNCKLTDQQVGDIRQQVLDRVKSIRELSREYGVSYNAIWSIVNQKSRPVTSSKRSCGPAQLSSDAIVQIREKRASGKELKELAEEYNLSKTSVHSICTGQTHKKVGGPITLANRGRKISEDVFTHMKKLRDEGLSYQKIADKYGVNKTTVMNHLK